MATSLRRRLILILTGLTVIAWLVSLALTAVLSRQLILEQTDRQLDHYMDMAQHIMGTALSVPQSKDHFLGSAGIVPVAPGVSRVSGFGSQGREQAINIWFPQQQILVGDATPPFPSPLSEGVSEQAVEGGGPGGTWRILYRHDPDLDVWLGAGIDMAFAPRVGANTLLRAIMPLLVIMPVSILILLWGVGRGLRPLDELAARIEDRNPAALDRIEPDGVPGELLPVVTSLNGLLDRLRRALASEQRFTSNAAHELQTPLAAIKAEVQRCQRTELSDEGRIMLERIELRVSRAVDTVAQLLTLARLDPETEFRGERVVLSDLVIDLVAEEGDLAAGRGLNLELEEDREAVIRGHPEWLRIMVRNLLSNAFKFAPLQGNVTVSTERRGREVLFSVVNDCTPIGDEQLSRLTDRFFTLPGREGSGVGLGLSIVQRIADLHGATLRLREDPAGHRFLAEVIFTPPRPEGLVKGQA